MSWAKQAVWRPIRGRYRVLGLLMILLTGTALVACKGSSSRESAISTTSAVGVAPSSHQDTSASGSQPRKLTHTHFRAVWMIADSSGSGQEIVVRDGSNYSITTPNPPIALRARGSHMQICDSSQCKLVTAKNAEYLLRSIYIDPVYGAKAFGLDTPSAGHPWQGHPTACLSGPDVLGSGTRTMCYLTDLGVLASMRATGGGSDTSSELTSLTAAFSDSEFEDLPGKLP
jgi:hypothetical protein